MECSHEHEMTIPLKFYIAEEREYEGKRLEVEEKRRRNAGRELFKYRGGVHTKALN
jgi:hypothetical protein